MLGRGLGDAFQPGDHPAARSVGVLHTRVNLNPPAGTMPHPQAACAALADYQAYLNAATGPPYICRLFIGRPTAAAVIPGTCADTHYLLKLDNILGPHAGRAAHPQEVAHRVELTNAIFEYLEIFHNRQRRHSALRMHTPLEYETIHHTRQPAA